MIPFDNLPSQEGLPWHRHPIVVSIVAGIILSIVSAVSGYVRFRGEQVLLEQRQSIDQIHTFLNVYQGAFQDYHVAVEGWLYWYPLPNGPERRRAVLEARSKLDAATSRLFAVLDDLPLVLPTSESDLAKPLIEPLDRIKRISYMGDARAERAKEVRNAIDYQVVPGHRRLLAAITEPLRQ